MKFLFCCLLFCVSLAGLAQPQIFVNQVGFDSHSPKTAVVCTDNSLPAGTMFRVVDSLTGVTVYRQELGTGQAVPEWSPGKHFYQADFSAVQKAGKYCVRIDLNQQQINSPGFEIGDHLLAKRIIPEILHYYRKQRANTAAELTADSQMLLYGSDQRVDVHGGWCDASGDVSKYFSHLAYANVMSPQQTPLVTWSLVQATENLKDQLQRWNLLDSIEDESIWGADYMMRCLSQEGYFYMIVFSYFNKDPNARRIVGLHANSVTTDEYQCAFREGGGMAIAALARISRWKKHGDFSSRQYLDAAERAFAHLQKYNTRYDDNGRENIIDDYCALMAATELWIATDSSLYAEAARKRAHQLEQRLTKGGWFSTDETGRPFFHASDAGLPVTALLRYLQKEKNPAERRKAETVINKAETYQLAITDNTANPFGYARQTFRYRDSIRQGFFIPHENETGWWWQGENARLASLAAAALNAHRVLQKGKETEALPGFAMQQVSWILGCNPYDMCFLYGFGQHNVPYMHSNFGHGSERGGISNGITGKDGTADGSGIDFRTAAAGNEWRWTEQWIPHAAWFLQAITALELGGL